MNNARASSLPAECAQFLPPSSPRYSAHHVVDSARSPSRDTDRESLVGSWPHNVQPSRNRPKGSHFAAVLRPLLMGCFSDCRCHPTDDPVFSIEACISVTLHPVPSGNVKTRAIPREEFLRGATNRLSCNAPEIWGQPSARTIERVYRQSKCLERSIRVPAVRGYLRI